jgi:hypothetical protein
VAEENDLRTFIREMTLRFERVADKLAKQQARATDAIVAHLDEQSLALAEMRLEIADSRKQLQANTQAVLSVLDRLG